MVGEQKCSPIIRMIDMEHSEFKIGNTFYLGGKEYRCTDIGTRTIAAICTSVPFDITTWDPINETLVTSKTSDVSWFNGPPYAVVEVIFDEYDIDGCTLENEDI